MKIAIVGLGLIGGSVGLAAKARIPDVEVVGHDRDEASAAEAVIRGAADRVAPSISEACSGADIIVVATPVSAISSVVAEALTSADSSAVVTDVGSTKAQVVLEVAELGPAGAGFVGGHPMAGSEDAGISAARPDLFQGAWWILTPTEGTDDDAYRRVRSLLTTLGAQVAALAPEEHDELMAVISHLPQLLATTLMNVAAGARGEGGSLALAAGGFRDVTRVAASDPDMWLDICRQNRRAIVASLDAFAGRLRELRDEIERADEQAIRASLTAAREARRALPAKPSVGDPCEVRIDIPDRPGVLAEITTTVGALGINIEDLGIIHTPEGGRGTLRMAVAGRDEAERVAAELQAKGYGAKAMNL